MLIPVHCLRSSASAVLTMGRFLSKIEYRRFNALLASGLSQSRSHNEWISRYLSRNWGRVENVGYLWRPVARGFRVKRVESSLTQEEQFIQRVLDKYGLKSADSDREVEILAQQASKLRLLVSAGCKVYELVEYPRVLLLDEAELLQRIGRLRRIRGNDSISIPLLKFVDGEKSEDVVRKRIQRYLEVHGGRVNRVDRIIETLRCTGDEMIDILIRSPRSIGVRLNLDLVPKIEYVLRHGARLEDIRSNMHALNNKTMSIIEARAKQLSELGFDKPLNVGIIGRDQKNYEAIVERMLRTPRAPHGHDSEKVITMLPGYSMKIHSLKPKVDFLLSTGYAVEDLVANAAIFVYSLERISQVVAYLRQHHLELPRLAVCRQYAHRLRITGNSQRPVAKKLFARVLGCSTKDIALFAPKDRESLVMNKESVMLENLVFLRERGFTNVGICRQPVVLAHDAYVLREHWERINTDPELSEWLARWRDDEAKRLSLIQYSIEKGMNFLTMTAIPSYSGVSSTSLRRGELFEHYTEQSAGEASHVVEETMSQEQSDDASDSDSDTDDIVSGSGMHKGCEVEGQRPTLGTDLSALGRILKV